MGALSAVNQFIHSASSHIYKARNNTEIFQKTAQIIASALQIKMGSDPSYARFSRLVKALDTANMHDFFGVLRDPYNELFPIRAEAIDEEVLAQALPGVPEANITQYLNTMRDRNKAFSNLEDLKADVTHCIGTAPDATSFTNVLRKKSLLQQVLRFNWLIIDAGCVTAYLKDWNLLNTSKLADRLGQYRVFSFVKVCDLDTCIIGAVFSAFALKCVHAVVQLRNTSFQPIGKKRATIDAITGGTEALLYGALLLKRVGVFKCGEIGLQCLTIGVKSLGIFCCVMKPNYHFFKVYQPATAV